MEEVFETITKILKGIWGCIIGIGDGFSKSFTGYFKGLSYSLHRGYSSKSRREYQEPAKEKYFFYKQYEDLNNTYKSACSVNSGDILVLKQQLRKKEVFIYGKVKAAQITIHIIGSLVNTICYIIHFFIVTFFSVPGYIVYLLIMAVEKVKINRGKIFGACYHCHTQFDVPYYVCPKCGRVHKRLMPGAYGFVKRECVCGEVMPCTNFLGRYKLKAICPVCSREIESRESSPICIPIVGEVSCGKTSFVYSALNSLINDVSKKNQWDISFLNDEEEEKIRGILELVNRGEAIKKTVKGDVKPYNLFISSKEFHNDELLYIYDAAGEYFETREDIRRQKYFKYCNRLIFVIDLNSIENVVESTGAIGNNTNIEDLIDRFILSLREVRGIELNKYIDIPIAVVVNKMDIINYKGTALEFLKEVGEEKIIRKFQYNFSNCKFFSCSTLQHSTEDEKGVFDVINWVLTQGNKEIK